MKKEKRSEEKIAVMNQPFSISFGSSLSLSLYFFSRFPLLFVHSLISASKAFFFHLRRTASIGNYGNYWVRFGFGMVTAMMDT
jgi:hypothetical protein